MLKKIREKLFKIFISTEIESIFLLIKHDRTNKDCIEITPSHGDYWGDFKIVLSKDAALAMGESLIELANDLVGYEG